MSFIDDLNNIIPRQKDLKEDFHTVVKRVISANGITGETPDTYKQAIQDLPGNFYRNLQEALGIDPAGKKPRDLKKLAGVVIGSVDHGASSILPKSGSVESLIEKSSGFAPGVRSAFDTAVMHRDAATVRKLLPQIPQEYKQKFAEEIAKVLSSVR